MPHEMVHVVHGTVLDDEEDLNLGQLCRMCRLHAEALIAMVEAGILEPRGETPGTWRFPGTTVTHVRVVVRLQRDLGVNLAGAAVVLDLLERVQRLSQGR